MASGLPYIDIHKSVYNLLCMLFSHLQLCIPIYGVAVKLAAAKMEIEGRFKICDVGLSMCNFPLSDQV